jgi:hypothetical protein
MDDLHTERDAIETRWQQLGVKIDTSVYGKTLDVSRIVVPKQSRGEGLGTRAMTDLTNLADKYGMQMSLSPSTDFGGSSVDRLKKFYKRFGFVENKGRNKDFTISATMIRPAATRAMKETSMSLTTDKKHWDDLHAAQRAKYDERRAYELELGSHYGHNFQPQWLKKGQRDKL